VRLACERPRKTLYGAILVISVRISTSAVRPPFSKSSVLNQLCVLSTLSARLQTCRVFSLSQLLDIFAPTHKKRGGLGDLTALQNGRHFVGVDDLQFAFLRLFRTLGDNGTALCSSVCIQASSAL